MATDARALEALMTPWVNDLGFELVRVTFKTAPGRGVIVQLMAEREDGTMTIDDCAELSRALSARLDAADPMPGEYVLEVSSPGIERPLTKIRDFERFSGREAWIETTRPVGGQRRFRGRLKSVEADGEAVLLERGGETVTIALSDIAKARLVPEEPLVTGRTGRGRRGTRTE